MINTSLELYTSIDKKRDRVSIEKIKAFVRKWNIMFPLDKRFRDKYKIPFGSTAHGDSCFVDIFTEYVEDMLYEELTEKEYAKLKARKEGKAEPKDEYIAGSGDIMRNKTLTMTDGEWDDMYSNMNMGNVVTKD